MDTWNILKDLRGEMSEGDWNRMHMHIYIAHGHRQLCGEGQDGRSGPQ